jgi:putative ABC transport system ATP-binding protein
MTASPQEEPRRSNNLIVQASEVVKTYATGRVEVRALRGVNLSVVRGEIIAIMGPSGCGKTTLLNCLSGLDTIDSGQIIVDGSDINHLSDNKKTDFRARRMGFVFQFYNLLPVLSAIENVELPLLVSGIAVKETRQRALAALEQVHLTEWANHRPAELSGGQRQRVTVARALVNDPAIVWGDEPTGDLDSTNAQQIMDLICELNRNQGQTFVLVTHDANIAARANRTVHMVDGLIVDETRNDGRDNC